MQSPSDKQLFFEVKQRLDRHRMPTSFAIQDLSLIQKLLQKLDKAEEGQQVMPKNAKNDQTLGSSSQVQQILNNEIARLTNQNNSYRRQMWQAMEQVQKLKLHLGRVLKDSNKNIAVEGDLNKLKILETMQLREQQIFAENEQIKYKYNELMNLIHQDPNFERTYIKRLLKHKQMQINKHKEVQNIPGTLQNIEKKSVSRDQQAQILLFQKMVLTRDEEILRLQTIINESKLYRPFKKLNFEKLNTKQIILQQQIDQLKKTNQKLVHQIQRKKMATQGKQVLVQKIQTLSKRLSESKEKQALVSRQSKEKDMQIRYYQRQSQRTRKHTKSSQQQNKTNQQMISHEDYYSYLPPKKEESKKNQKGNLARSNDRQSSRDQRDKNSVNKFNSSKNIKKIEKLGHTGPTTAHSVQNEALLDAYKKLLSDKNQEIQALQNELRAYQQQEGHKHKKGAIISIQNHKNVNAGKVENSKYVIKNNKNEYITFNTPGGSEESNNKKIIYLEKKIMELQRQKTQLQFKLRQQKDLHKQARSNSFKQSNQQKNQLMKRLDTAQKSLINTNELNLTLQRQLAELLRVQYARERPVISNDQDSLQQNADENAMLRKEIQRLIGIINQLEFDRLQLNAKVSQLQKQLKKQSSEMGTFERKRMEIIEKRQAEIRESGNSGNSALSDQSKLLDK